MNVQLILCENGKSKTAWNIQKKYAEKLPCEISYLKEERIGIVYMRNRILDEAINNSLGFSRFFDDDEIVSDDWLIQLNAARIRFSADVVQGHIVQEFPKVPNLDLLRKFFPGTFAKSPATHWKMHTQTM